MPKRPADDALLPGTILPRALLAAIDALVAARRARAVMATRADVVRELLVLGLGAEGSAFAEQVRPLGLARIVRATPAAKRSA